MIKLEKLFWMLLFNLTWVFMTPFMFVFGADMKDWCAARREVKEV